jgi:aminoglycoside phosphotransferase (APT) family kinase protein
MAACGQIAAAIHSSGIELGRERTLESEVAWQEQRIAELGRVSPELGAQLLAWLRQTAEAGRSATPLPLGFAHGDFTYTQLIFDGARSGLVDFDTVCQAEPALDLGQFLAYQRLAIRRNQRPGSPADLAEQLGAGFLDAYLAAMGERVGDERALRARAHIYELLMLSRLAIHSWQKLKVSRMEQAMKLIEERIAWLP